MMSAIHVRITGRVQGVFFRVHLKETADRLGIKGWVRNEPDGSVLVHAEGSEEELRQLEEWCQYGPPAAKVDHVERKEVTSEKHITFEIRRD